MDVLDSMEPRKWKGKYPVSWCNLCDCAYIDCMEESCHGTSCNGGGCPKCDYDTTEFNKVCKTTVEDYLTDEEKKVYWKCREIKKLILESIRNGDNSIDFLKMQKNGELSRHQEEVFGLVGDVEKSNIDNGMKKESEDE